MSHIREPRRIPPPLRLGIFIAEKVTGKRMEPARILSWHPKAAVSSGVLEALVSHKEKGISKRLLQLVRMQVSVMVNCSFCIDMNGKEFEKQGITTEEVEALQGRRKLEEVPSFSRRERVALQYTRELTSTPAVGNGTTIRRMKRHFDEKQFVVIVSTIAQVNYWARLIKGLGVPPAGFRPDCSL
ncbi:carboxymuconolactone decarboxylase family protein [Anaerotalea alkaliphila]|uniref:Carboxymuconolactone decarboxylase family protein n=1 Tax=Anaerotalea alkaliphila TaxID=2662126 RepID=A0A7X5KP35_9FIRM|nr:carboxymuconolactone decarboxylase family protein [Anaerotalea alkaliphila]NDL67457.1 carboxymuconolactone decarboxylase family protein [Anaerotalea alkaliphila]